MSINDNDIIYNNKIFFWIAVVTGAVLFLPLIAMQFTEKFAWILSDFMAMGILLFGTGSFFVLVARRVSKKYRLVVGIIFVFTILYIWAELAVGLFTKLGS